ncbi:redoxin domain-containing protein [Candidatus Pacearchaeota archaeon]|nr:redoxin domain-containing protein [Candidatus Pacearchaeota archaeon]
MPTINQRAPDFEAKALHENKIKDVKLSDYREKWVVLFFYPGDFTFICPTELGELADNHQKFRELNTEILSVSTDSEFVHKAWYDISTMVKKIQYPMIADPTGKIAKSYGVYIWNEGVALRGTFIINPNGILKAFEIHDNSIGRNTEELLRKVQAAQYTESHNGEVCPASWKPGKETLKPGLDLVGKI